MGCTQRENDVQNDIIRNNEDLVPAQHQTLIMKNTSYTPGPWKIGTPPPNGEQTIGTEQGLMVAVATTGVGFADTLANARLIAAAPDLLEACIAAKNGDPRAYQLLPASIAKATGAA